MRTRVCAYARMAMYYIDSYRHAYYYDVYTDASFGCALHAVRTTRRQRRARRTCVFYENHNEPKWFFFSSSVGIARFVGIDDANAKVRLFITKIERKIRN